MDFFIHQRRLYENMSTTQFTAAIAASVHNKDASEAIENFAWMTKQFFSSDPRACVEAGLLIRDFLWTNRLHNRRDHSEMARVLNTFDFVRPITA